MAQGIQRAVLLGVVRHVQYQRLLDFMGLVRIAAIGRLVAGNLRPSPIIELVRTIIQRHLLAGIVPVDAIGNRTHLQVDVLQIDGVSFTKNSMLLSV